MTRLHKPFLAAAFFASVAAVGLTPALAQTAPANGGMAAGEAPHQARVRMMPGQFVDRRIAFLKAELKITPAEEAQWQQVEAAMRENAKTLDQIMTTARQNRAGTNAVQHLELRYQFAKVRAENNDRFLAAFKPLYASLSPEQQRTADQLIAAAQHRWHHRA
jgi:Spy/CpxP family protein refolding chaperone